MITPFPGESGLTPTPKATLMTLICQRKFPTEGNKRHGEGVRAMVCGQSMLPSLSPGTWIWIHPVRLTSDRKRNGFDLRLGDIIVFQMEGVEELVCHRVIGYNRQWIWQASEHYGTGSRIPRSTVLGKVYAWEQNEGEKQVFSTSARFTGLFRCYRKVMIRQIRRWVQQLHSHFKKHLDGS
jgi:hypothetical protein